MIRTPLVRSFALAALVGACGGGGDGATTTALTYQH